MQYFKRLKSDVDPKPFLDEIESIDDAWAQSTGRQDKIEVQREALAIPLRGLRKSAIGDRKRRDVHESRWTNSSAPFVLARQFLEAFALEQDGILGRAKIVCLPAGKRVYPHIDRGEYYRVRNRYHFVLRSTDGSWLKAGNEEVRMKEGELWWFDNDQMHEAHNDGEQDRIHVIFDMLPSHRAEAVLAQLPDPKRRITMMALAIAHAAASDEPAANLLFRPASEPGGLACWLAVPDRVAGDKPPLVAVHGIRRDARQQAELFAQRANALGRPVIAPLFSEQEWPRYQQAIRRGRADLALIALMEALSAEGICRTSRFEMLGFSGGAQFAHRFAMMHPQLITRLTVASAGWYTFPDSTQFPYGFSARTDGPDPWSAVTEDRIRRFLAIPTQVCVGADDTLRDANLRAGDRIDAQQGENRLIRGIRWAQALRRAAEERGLPPRAAFFALSACDHRFRQCVLRGGLDQIVMPVDDGRRPVTGRCGRQCATCDQPCKSRIDLLEPVS